MTYPSYVREKARSLRAEKRLTIDEIAERLAVSRGSVYGWVRDLPFDANTPPAAGRSCGRRGPTAGGPGPGARRRTGKGSLGTRS